MEKKWLEQKEMFEVKDVRALNGNFLPGILNKAKQIEKGKGLCVVQSFEPVPLYSALEELGYERYTDKVSDTEYRIYFYRSKIDIPKYPNGMDIPLKPTAVVNLKNIDPQLANVAVGFWDLMWGKENAAIDLKTRLLLSLANGVGAGRIRQATRELVKAYSLGVTVPELDELFVMFAWNQGIGHFASEVGPSPLFAAYQLIKKGEEKGLERSEIVKQLTEKFGEKNPDVNTFYKMVK